MAILFSRGGPTKRSGRRQSFTPRLENLEDRTVLSTLTVLNNLDTGAGSLRDAIGRARDGDTIAFASRLNGETIVLTSDELAIKKSLDIEGPGADKLAISGNDAFRVFEIVNQGLTVTITGLTITHGWTDAPLGGGAIVNAGSTLTLANDVVCHNQAVDSDNQNGGGAITNRGGATLLATNSTFFANQVVGREGGGSVGGGGILSFKRSTATVIGCTFTGNRAVGGDGGVISSRSAFIGVGSGGAIQQDSGGTLSVENCTFTGNQAIGGDGGNGGAG